MSSKESVTRIVPNVPSIKILPPQLARLKKEEEEETWISGEELYTEGSSDEESCRCKSVSSDKASAESSLSVAKAYRPKIKADKKKKASNLLSDDKYTLSAQSSSKGRTTPMSSVSDEDDEYRDDDEISWKANREELLLQDEIIELEEYQEKYPKICQSIDAIFENYFVKLNNLEKVKSEVFIRKNEKLQEELKKSLSFVDTVISELHEKIENIKKSTKKIQIQNRIRLKEIIAEGPPESKKLAQNSKKFFELCM